MCGAPHYDRAPHSPASPVPLLALRLAIQFTTSAPASGVPQVQTPRLVAAPAGGEGAALAPTTSSAERRCSTMMYCFWGALLFSGAFQASLWWFWRPGFDFCLGGNLGFLVGVWWANR
jgi:hypothetical protein